MHRWLAVEELDDIPVQPGQVAQPRFPVRVGQATGIEDDIGIDRYTVLETKRAQHH